MEFIEETSERPEIIVYDDACHLSKYIQNSNLFIRKSERAKILSNCIIVCDRFHFLTHVDKWCQKNCNPDLIPELEDVNTSVCEETNLWFGRFKHAFKHMNYQRFHFLLYILSNEYNKFKLVDYQYEQKKNLVNKS